MIILLLIVGSSGCMTMPPCTPPMESVKSQSHPVKTTPAHRQSVHSFRQQQAKQQQIRQQPAKQQQVKQQPAKQQQQQQQWAMQNTSHQNQSSTPWNDLLELLGLSKPLVIPHSLNVPAVQQPSKVKDLSLTAKSNSITQVAYQLPQPFQSQNVPQITQQPVRPAASPELYQPWNLDNYRVKRSVLNPYRLVSDGQETIANRTTPPVMNKDRLVTLSQLPQITNSSLNNQIATQENSIFSLGQDLAKEFIPSNNRKWSQNHAVLQTAEWHGDMVTIHNIRYSKYETEERYTTQYYDATFDLNDILTLDLVVVPFRGIPRLAHVESSFGFADGRHVGMSIEARYEEGECYDPIGAGLRQFELIYVFADERDMIRIGTDVNKNDVHIYRLKFAPEEVRAMFVDALQRANKLAEKPEFYHPLSNSCVTNLIKHINKGRPKAIPKEYRTLLPGLMDHYVYDLKLIDTNAKTFQEAKENAKVNWLVEKFGDLEYFSAGIRQNMY